METTTQLQIEQMQTLLSASLKRIQENTIGLFRPTYDKRDHYIPVIENNNGLLTCIETGSLLGLSTSYIEEADGRYVPFSDNKSLSEMMEDPIKFHNWYQENVFSLIS